MPSKQPVIVRAKALISFVGTRFCRLKGAKVARRLTCSTTAVSRAALRGKQLYKEDADLQASMNSGM